MLPSSLRDGCARCASSAKSTIIRIFRFVVEVGEAIIEEGGRIGGGGSQSSGVLEGIGEARL